MQTSDRLWKTFIIPENILSVTHFAFSPLVDLPDEILCMIFEHTDLVTQFTLALSCKRLLQASTLITFKCLPFINRPVYQQPVYMQKLLRRLKPLPATGREMRKWRLCVDCLQYRPGRASYWLKKEHIWKEFGAGWTIGDWTGSRCSLQCPGCKYLERKETLEEYRQYGIRASYMPWSIVFV